jgi:PilZ domain
MAEGGKLQKMLKDYTTLLVDQKVRALTSEELLHLELLRDVLLEAGAILDAAENHRPRRTPRADLALDVQFGTHEAAAKAWTQTRDVSAGGVSLVSDLKLAVGTSLDLKLNVPGMAAVQVHGKVAWTRDGVLGIAFLDLSPETQESLKSLVASNESFLGRLRSSLAKTASTPARAVIKGRRNVALGLADGDLKEGVLELLALSGLAATSSIDDGLPPNLLVADTDNVGPLVAKHAQVPLILVGVSGPGSLMGRLASLRPVAFIKRPATPSAIIEAVLQHLPTG